MSTVALIATSHIDNERIYHPPVALIYLGSLLQREGYNVRIYHVTKHEETKIKEIAALPALSMIGLSTFLGPSMGLAVGLAKCLKLLTDVPIVIGGKFVSAIPELIVEEACFDTLCIGEGESVISALASQPQERIVYGKAQVDLDSLPYDLNLVRDWSLYVSRKEGTARVTSFLETQRGCRFRCGFCHHSLHASRLRFHSPEWVLDKAERLKMISGVNSISFCDDNFLADPVRGLEILSRLDRIGISVPVVSAHYSVLNNKELVRDLSLLSVKKLKIGLESGSDRMLRFIQKGITRKTVIQAVDLLSQSAKPEVRNLVVLGCPTETEREMRSTIDFVAELMRRSLTYDCGFNFYHPLPGTKFYNKAIELGFLPPANLAEWSTSRTYRKPHEQMHTWLHWFTPLKRWRYRLVGRHLALYRAALNVKTDKDKPLWKRVLGLIICWIQLWRIRWGFFGLSMEIVFWDKFYGGVKK